MLDVRRTALGFTLIEVVVALLVVSLGMLGVIQAVGQTASNSGYLRDKTLAHWVGMNRLTEVRLQKSAPAIDKSSDEVEMGGRRWKWTMDITVRPEDSREGTKLATVTGFYGTAVAPPGSALIAWQGSDGGAPGQPGDKDKDKDDEEQPNQPPPEDIPPEPEDPQDGPDPSDPTQQQQ
jgi:general secretion pathway protein I